MRRLKVYLKPSFLKSFMIKKKVIFLFLALLLPIAVFIFLKSFGKNEFAVQPLFQDSVSVPIGCSSFSYPVPYVTPDTVLAQVFHEINDSLALLVFDDS